MLDLFHSFLVGSKAGVFLESVRLESRNDIIYIPFED